MSNIGDTVEHRIQNEILTAVDNIVAPKIELAIRSVNASSGRDATSVTANAERGEHVGITPLFENASGNNNVLRISNVNDETRNNIPDEVSELSLPETYFDQQTHTHHRRSCCVVFNSLRNYHIKISVASFIPPFFSEVLHINFRRQHAFHYNLQM